MKQSKRLGKNSGGIRQVQEIQDQDYNKQIVTDVVTNQNTSYEFCLNRTLQIVV
jgi:hypothetical protein